MSIIGLIVLLVILGLLFFLVEQIPMAAPYPTIIRVIAIVFAILLVLNFFAPALGLGTGVTLFR